MGDSPDAGNLAESIVVGRILQGADQLDSNLSLDVLLSSEMDCRKKTDCLLSDIFISHNGKRMMQTLVWVVLVGTYL